MARKRKPTQPTIADLEPSAHQHNRGTERGLALLEESIEKCGLGRSIVVDKHGVTIAGNKTLLVAKKRGVPIKVVPVHGDRLVAVQRTDLHLYRDRKARTLAYYDNRVGEVDLAWDAAQLHQDVLEGVDLGQAFFPNELPPPPEPEGEPAPVEPPVETFEVTPVAEPEEPEPEPLNILDEKVPDAPFKTGTAGGCAILFERQEQHLRWNAFVRFLKQRYPDEKYAATRLFNYIREMEGL